jgi:hypothetical protein
VPGARGPRQARDSCRGVGRPRSLQPIQFQHANRCIFRLDPRTPEKTHVAPRRFFPGEAPPRRRPTGRGTGGTRVPPPSAGQRGGGMGAALRSWRRRPGWSGPHPRVVARARLFAEDAAAAGRPQTIPPQYESCQHEIPVGFDEVNRGRGGTARQQTSCVRRRHLFFPPPVATYGVSCRFGDDPVWMVG